MKWKAAFVIQTVLSPKLTAGSSARVQDLAKALGEDVGNILSDGCGPEFIDPVRMLNIQRWLNTSFLDAQLRDSEIGRQALVPAALPGDVAADIEYSVSDLP